MKQISKRLIAGFLLANVTIVSAGADPLVGNLIASERKDPAIVQEVKPSLTAKFTRSASAEKFNAAPNEKITYVGDDPTEHMLPADQTPAVRVNKDAPGPFIAMKKAYDEGDLETAHAFADQYVRYMQRVMFEVRELSQMVGEALVRNGVVDEEDWVGASQFMGRELARDQATKKVAFKATAEVALERIQADKNGKAEVYVFLALLLLIVERWDHR